jgi:hypothetical protein
MPERKKLAEGQDMRNKILVSMISGAFVIGAISGISHSVMAHRVDSSAPVPVADGTTPSPAPDGFSWG